jgi:hypothetical protein
VTITVLPIANDDSATVDANTILNQTTSVLSNDIGTGLSVHPFQNSPTREGGIVSMNSNGTYTYAPANDFSGDDTFTYNLIDQAQNRVLGKVTVTVLPEAENDVGTTSANDPLNGSSVFSNDAGTGLTIVKYTPVSSKGGQVVMNPDGTYIYTPPKNFSGTDKFGYTEKDQLGNESKATVAITVNPVAFPDEACIPINVPLNQVFSVLDNDVGSGLFISDYDKTSSQGGIVDMQPNGTYVYTPPYNLIGEDSFSYTVSDSSGNKSTTTVNIYITDSYPNSSFTTYANEISSGLNVLNQNQEASLRERASLRVKAVDLRVIQFQNPSNKGGKVSLDKENGTFTYTPPINFSGIDTFIYINHNENGKI